MNRGIVLNIEGIAGNIEIFNSTFTQNMHYIPELTSGSFAFKTTYPDADIEEAYLDYENWEYKIAHCFGYT